MSTLPLYHTGEQQRCPVCQGRRWWIGRSTAECQDCNTALAIAHPRPHALYEEQADGA